MATPTKSEQQAVSQLHTLNAYSGLKFLYLAITCVFFSTGWLLQPDITAVLATLIEQLKVVRPDWVIRLQTVCIMVASLVALDVLNQVRVINTMYVIRLRNLDDKDHLQAVYKAGKRTVFNWINCLEIALLVFLILQICIYADNINSQHHISLCISLVGIIIRIVSLHTDLLLFLVSPVIRNEISDIKLAMSQASSLDHISLTDNSIGLVGLAKALTGAAARQRHMLQELRTKLGMANKD